MKWTINSFKIKKVQRILPCFSQDLNLLNWYGPVSGQVMRAIFFRNKIFIMTYCYMDQKLFLKICWQEQVTGNHLVQRFPTIWPHWDWSRSKGRFLTFWNRQFRHSPYFLHQFVAKKWMKTDSARAIFMNFLLSSGVNFSISASRISKHICFKFIQKSWALVNSNFWWSYLSLWLLLNEKGTRNRPKVECLSTSSTSLVRVSNLTYLLNATVTVFPNINLK